MDRFPVRQIPFWLAFTLSCLFASIIILGVRPLEQSPLFADSVADWLVTSAFIEGDDPYQPIEQLARRYEVEYISPRHPLTPVHPRLPGALVLQTPLILADADTSGAWLLWSGVVALSGAVAYIVAREPRPVVVAVLIPAATFLSGVAAWGLIWVVQSLLIAAVVFTSWIVVVQGKRPLLAGLLIGLCGLLKPFVLILLVPLALRREVKAVVSCSISFLVGNLVPMILSNIGPGDVYEALRDTFSTWFTAEVNISLGAMVSRTFDLGQGWVIPLHFLAFTSWLFLSRKGLRPLTAEWLGWAIAGVLLSPISWPHYVIVAFPFVWMALLDPKVSRPAKWLIGLGLLAFLPYSTAFYPLGFALMAIGVFASGLTGAQASSNGVASEPLSV